MSASFSELSDFPSFKTTFGRTSLGDFTLVNINIRSIRQHGEELKAIAECLMDFVDAFVVTEINATEDFMRSFSLNGYTSRSTTRQNRRGGGIAVFVSSKFDTSPVDVTFVHAESLSIKIHSVNQDFLLLAIYRPPCNSAVRFVLELDDVLKRWSSVDQVFVAGDININILCPTKAMVSDYLSVLASCGFMSTIVAPTREEILNCRVVTSCLDHIAVRAANHFCTSCVVTQKLSDHYFVACRVAINTPPSVSRHSCKVGAASAIRVTFVDKGKLDGLIANFAWLSLMEDRLPHQVYDKFCERLADFERSSTFTRNKKCRKNYTWINSDIMQAIAYRDWLWKKCKRAPKNEPLRLEYKVARNKVVALFRAAKRRFFFHKFNESSKNAGKTWSLVNHLRGNSNKENSVAEHFSGSAVETANLFNHFFCQASTAASAKSQQDVTLRDSLTASAFLPRLSKSDLARIIFSFRINKPPGIDGISVGILTRNFDALADIVLFMLNGFLDTAVIPKNLKTALVRPLHKAGKKSNFENYRPISILPVLSQVLEKFLLEVMNSFIHKFSILSDRQFGFVQGRGTIALLEEFSDELCTSFEDNLFCCALFLDVSKAFDTVCHDILLRKLYLMGFRGPFHAVLKNYLADRSQKVVIGNTYSSTKLPLGAGVPQGSILSPLLFNLFVNDFVSIIPNGKVFQYADDIVLVTKHVKYKSAVDQLQESVYTSMSWFLKNNLTVNNKKTKVICFKNPLKLGETDLPVFLHLHACTPCTCTPVEYTNTIKYLGIHFDSDLSWQSHSAYVCSRLRSVACLLFNVRSLVPFPVKKMIVHALAYSILRYGITVFGFCPGGWQDRIDNLLRNILKSVAYNRTASLDKDICAELGFHSFKSLFTSSVVLRHFWTDDFKLPYISPRQLRKPTRFVVPRFSTRYGAARRCVYIPKIFNNLPDEIFSVKSQSELKCLLLLLQESNVHI